MLRELQKVIWDVKTLEMEKEGKEVWAVPGLEKYHGEDLFLTEVLSKEVRTALDEPVAKKQPFFLYFALYGIHTPFDGK
jgi:hypothetical protein